MGNKDSHPQNARNDRVTTDERQQAQGSLFCCSNQNNRNNLTTAKNISKFRHALTLVVIEKRVPQTSYKDQYQRMTEKGRARFNFEEDLHQSERIRATYVNKAVNNRLSERFCTEPNDSLDDTLNMDDLLSA